MNSLNRKCKIRFSPEDDLYLLREVYGHNPYEDPKRWNLIQINIFQITGKHISISILRKRVLKLVKKFLAKDEKNHFKSGIDEEVTELGDLLRHIADLMNNFKNNKSQNEYALGFAQREDAIMAASSSTLTHESHSIYNETFEDVGSEVTIHEVIVEESNVKENNKLSETYIQETQKTDSVPEKIESRKRPWPQRNILGPIKRKQNSGIEQTTIQYLGKKMTDRLKLEAES